MREYKSVPRRCKTSFLHSVWLGSTRFVRWVKKSFNSVLLIKQYSNLINVVKSLYQARRVKTKHEQPFAKSHKKMQQRKDIKRHETL